MSAAMRCVKAYKREFLSRARSGGATPRDDAAPIENDITRANNTLTRAIG